jgi:hypothetical protein
MIVGVVSASIRLVLRMSSAAHQKLDPHINGNKTWFCLMSKYSYQDPINVVIVNHSALLRGCTHDQLTKKSALEQQGVLVRYRDWNHEREKYVMLTRIQFIMRARGVIEQLSPTQRKP